MRIQFSLFYKVVAGGFIVTALCIYFSVWKWKDLRLKPFHVFRTTREFSVAELMGSSDVFAVVKPNVSTIMSQPSMPFLKGQSKIKRPFAVILVTSLAKYFNQRRAIRLTWYKWAEKLNIRVFFMIGYNEAYQKQIFYVLQQEQRLYDDLIIDKYEEGYYRLPGKILRMLKWYNATYSEENAPRFLVKTDQDVFINLPNLVSALQNTSYYKNMIAMSKVQNSSNMLQDNVNLPFDQSDPETYFIGGKRFENAPVDDDPDSKWYIESSEREKFSWTANLYPTYANGPCYVMSGNIVTSIYEMSFNVPIYPFEDVYIVGMIAYDRLNLFISNLNGMYLHGNYITALKNRKPTQKGIAYHPIDHPYIMVKICKKISSCKENLGNYATKTMKVNLLSLYFTFFIIVGGAYLNRIF